MGNKSKTSSKLSHLKQFLGKNFYRPDNVKAASLDYKLQKEDYKLLTAYAFLAIILRAVSCLWFQHPCLILSITCMLFSSMLLVAVRKKSRLFLRYAVLILCFTYVYYSFVFTETLLVLGPIAIIAFPALALLLSKSFVTCVISFIIQSCIGWFMCKPKLAEMWFVMDRQALDQMLSSLLAQSMQLSIGICTVIVLILKLKSMLITKVYLQKQQLEELNAKLMQNNKELEENLKSKNDFILSFSHELRNPLNSIVGNLELIGMRNTDDTIQKYLSAAKHSGEFLMFLINNILDSAKAETNQLEKTEMSINTSDFFNKSWSIFGSLIRSRGLIGELHLGVNLPATLKIDSHRTMQIMFNLIGNAAKFTETGSVKVVVSWIAGDKLEDKMLLPSESDESVDESGSYYTTQAGTAAFPKSVSYSITGIKLCSSPEKPAKVPYDESGLQMLSTTIEDVEHNKDSKMQEGFLKMEVIDTGIGISSEEVANLFKKYSQLSGEHKRLGSGLGLWITHHLCKLMQGDIKAFSKPKQGSTFVTLLQAKARGTIINKNLKAPVVPTLELPAKSKAFRKEVPAPPPIPSLPLARDNIMAKDNRIRVLVVEDNEFNQMLIKNFLENLGVLVVGIAPNGLEAVKLLTVTNRLIDAVILDIEMPIMDGIQAAQIIRQYEGSNKLKPIYMAMVTGNCNEQQFKLCRQKEGPIRADAIFRKPFAYSDCQNMVTGIAQYVDRK